MSIRAYKVLKPVEEAGEFTFDAGESFDFVENYGSWKAFNENGELVEVEFDRETLENVCIDGEVTAEEKKLARKILDLFNEGDYTILFNCH